MTTSIADAFGSLAALELISAHQRLAVERHPACAAFLALQDPVQQLVWMVEHQIVTEDELDDMLTFDEVPSEREAILQAAMQDIECANDVRNGRFLDALLKDGVITPIQHAAARRDPSGLHNDSAADLLYELILFEIVTPADFAATRRRMRATAGASGGLQRLQLVDQVQSRLDTLKKSRRRKAQSMLLYTDPARAKRLGWTYLGAIALAIAALAWLLFY